MMALGQWRARLDRLDNDVELVRLAPGLDVVVAFVSGDDVLRFAIRDGALLHDPDGPADVTVTASEQDWCRTLADPAPPTFHAFTAWELANDGFQIVGDTHLRAQARAALERVVDVALAPTHRPGAEVPRDVAQIVGRVFDVPLAASRAEIHCDIAGTDTALPILFLHTAGADARQFRAQLADPELAARFRMVAPDLPFHGRSLPPDSWDGGAYSLTRETYMDWCAAILDHVIGRPAILCGGSMGAAMALDLAARRSHLVMGVVALEPPFRSRGRRSPWQNHVAVHGGLHNSAFVRGLMSPLAPEANRRQAAWIYAQGGPGIYSGDLLYYSEEFDGAETGPMIDTGRTPVALLSGAYDYSATPEDGAALARAIPGALHVVMDDLGHFPMIENPAALRPHLLRALNHVTRHRPNPEDQTR